MAKKRQKGKEPPAGRASPPHFESSKPESAAPSSREDLRSQLRRAAAGKLVTPATGTSKKAPGNAQKPAAKGSRTPSPAAKERPSGQQTPKDRGLWDHVTQQVAPLPGRRFLHHDKLQVPLSAPKDRPKYNPCAVAKSKPGGKSRQGVLQPHHPLLPLCQPAKPVTPGLAHGQVAALDKRHAERLKRGRLGIDAKIDLHGLYQAEAHMALNEFIARSYQKGHRCLLVVTGKGLGQEEGGVLKRQTPNWLNQAPNRSKILAFDYAQPKDGGSGALYVLLKRQRG
ncbi:Smr/MutS family protein [Rhodovibrionaceae bacterium A322]